jgi:hypothetical protein
MKKLVLSFILLTCVILASSGVQAQRYEIGADVAVKVDYFRFMDSTLGDLNLQNGVYVGIEAYKQLLVPNLFFGMEVGWAGTDSSSGVWRNQLLLSSIDLDISYVPIEFNVKYVIPIQPGLKLDFGGGLSYNYLKFNIDGFFGSASDSDWVFGGQFFTALNYTFTNNLYLGVEVKYQLTQNIKDLGLPSDVSADNLRVGGQFGYKF